jgi:hypothetical protein
MKMRHSNVHLSIYGMGDMSAFMIKGGAPYIRNVRRVYFRDKRRCTPSIMHLSLLA